MFDVSYYLSNMLPNAANNGGLLVVKAGGNALPSYISIRIPRLAAGSFMDSESFDKKTKQSMSVKEGHPPSSTHTDGI